MATFVTIPKLGMNMEEGLLLQWLVAEGTTVGEGQAILEIETDKANVEIEAPASGLLARILRQPGESVPINGVVAVIVDPGEPMPDVIPETAA